jgi:hypothetical protein
MEGMATADPLRAQPTAAYHAEAFDRLHGVFGAAGMETAALAQQGTDEQFVATQQQDGGFFHGLRRRGGRTKVAAGEGLGYNTPPSSLKEREESP